MPKNSGVCLKKASVADHALSTVDAVKPAIGLELITTLRSPLRAVISFLLKR